MKTILTLLHVILIAPLVAFAQNENTNLAKPEVALATKAAKRAWESGCSIVSLQRDRLHVEELTRANRREAGWLLNQLWEEGRT